MLKAVEGVYKNGMIQLCETPEGVAESRVIVTFLAEKTAPNAPQLVKRGMFPGEIKTNEEDFQMAEFHGDPGDGLNW
ncbi:MAG: hypothetical protein KME10_24585 [Plectolyngbya sp. WJT66-NPBG17]|jgi:hypothetical protein|nr:hypothetical protein [Plectolyngbya sp. WJT66-NPBG17]MBW4526901.1 hypothetical protein [Phormidium tanganyikae FI6-MK23]